MTPHRPSWRNPKILAMLCLVFLLGATCGALTMRLGRHTIFHRATPAWREGGKDISIYRLRKDLDLSESQAEQMEVVLDDFMTYIQTLQAQMDDVRSTGKARIMRILNEDQRRRFTKLLADIQSRQPN
ncbi:MAG: hypothetical protein IT160_13330 [Bryobacterales bacterium]|nr:hypothetical protein [Bryobacterales bacterium]